jgi:hypothetical protein
MGQALPKLTARGLIPPEELPLLRGLVEIVVHGGAADLAMGRFLRV